MKEKKMGEFDLIARLTALLPDDLPEGVVGIGDDTAALPSGDGFLLLTCDIAVEGRHFLKKRTSLADVGWKVASSNVSDLAACGGVPSYALISLGLPDDGATDQYDDLYRGLGEAARQYGFHVIGGNVSGAEQLMVDCFMVGTAPKFIARKGCRPGDLLAVSGTLGDSDAGRVILAEGGNKDQFHSLLNRHLRPTARKDLVDSLLDWATAAIDISDSLAAELHHISESSGVALQVDAAQLPISQDLKAFSEARDEVPLNRALYGGEDYQILCALPPEKADLAEAAGFTLIGKATQGEGVKLSGKPLPNRGWDHFS